MTDYPEVKRIYEGNASHIEPPLDQDWTDLERLIWHAAVAKLDTGLRVLVHPTQDVMGRNLYSVQVENSSRSATGYEEAWVHISSVITGAQAMLYKLRLDEIDRNARAYGWEVGNGKEAKDVIEASPDNPYLKENDGNQG